MSNYDINKYRQWLNERKESLKGGLGDNKPDSAFNKKQLSIGVKDETGEHTKSKQVGKEIAKDHLSADPDYYKKIKKAGIEEPKKKLSKYWKIRAKRRANRGGRGYPNKVDESWALEQQIKSESINNRINKLFEKELTVGEELSDNIDEYIKKIEEERASMFKMPKSFGKNKKPKGSISVALAPVYGGVAKGYRKKLNKLKKKGMVGVAPGESFGPMQENTILNEFSYDDLKAAYEKIKKYVSNIPNISFKTLTSMFNAYKQFSNELTKIREIIKNGSEQTNLTEKKYIAKKNPGFMWKSIEKHLIPIINNYGLLPAGLAFIYAFVVSGDTPPQLAFDIVLNGSSGKTVAEYLGNLAKIENFQQLLSSIAS
jgi:predicted DNA-binding ArsR family transcriptional regulator